MRTKPTRFTQCLILLFGLVMGALAASPERSARADGTAGNTTSGRTSAPPRPVRLFYAVPSGNADLIAAILQMKYKKAPWVRISAVGDGLIVLAPPDDQLDVAIYLIPVRGRPLR
jgi:hypothetical protein